MFIIKENYIYDGEERVGFKLCINTGFINKETKKPTYKFVIITETTAYCLSGKYNLTIRDSINNEK